VGGSSCLTVFTITYRIFLSLFPKKEDPRHGIMWLIDPFAANNEYKKLNMTEKRLRFF
jgi:hypothetical protein